MRKYKPEKMIAHRGLFLEAMIVLEAVMAQLISLHFCSNRNDRTMEFLHVIAFKEAFSLNFKIEVVGFILKNHYPSILSDEPKIISELSDFRKMRNDFAHALPSNSNTDDSIVFIRYTTKGNKMEERTMVVTDDEIRINIDRILAINNIFRNLVNDIRTETKG